MNNKGQYTVYKEERSRYTKKREQVEGTATLQERPTLSALFQQLKQVIEKSVENGTRQSRYDIRKELDYLYQLLEEKSKCTDRPKLYQLAKNMANEVVESEEDVHRNLRKQLAGIKETETLESYRIVEAYVKMYVANLAGYFGNLSQLQLQELIEVFYIKVMRKLKEDT